MTNPGNRPRYRATAGTAVSLPALALVLVLALGGCGGSSRPGAAAAAVRKTCTQVGAVLSDGPDPGSDPVGYALAQVIPLRQIHTPDRALAAAISRLAEAYHRFYVSHGTSGPAKQNVAAATKAISSFCPGAAA